MIRGLISGTVGQLNPIYVLIFVLVLGLGIVSMGCNQDTSTDATAEGSSTNEATPTEDVFGAQTGRGIPKPSSRSDMDSDGDRGQSPQSGDRSPSDGGSRGDRKPSPQSFVPTSYPSPTKEGEEEGGYEEGEEEGEYEEASLTSNFGNNDNSHGNHGDDWMFDRGTGVNAPDGNSLFGGPGNDHIVGGENSDDIYGGADNDWVWGRSGEDYLVGGDHGGQSKWVLGHDRLYGGDGWDQLIAAELMVGGVKSDGIEDKCSDGQFPVDCTEISDPLYECCSDPLDPLIGLFPPLNPPFKVDTLLAGAVLKDNFGILGQADWCESIVQYGIFEDQTVLDVIKEVVDSAYFIDISAIDLDNPLEEQKELFEQLPSGNYRFFGTDGDDVIVGTEGADEIHGKDGDDFICGRGGADTIYGGGQNDRLYGGEGEDQLFGEGGRDILWGGPGDDQQGEGLSGGPGGDWIDGGPGNDKLVGGWGEDVLYGRSGTDNLYGDSSIKAEYESSYCLIDPDFEKVAVLFTRCTDWLVGGMDNDLLWGGPGNDIMQGDIFFD